MNLLNGIGNILNRSCWQALESSSGVCICFHLRVVLTFAPLHLLILVNDSFRELFNVVMNGKKS